MPRSHVARGAYYKARTRRWLEAQGYQVFDLEVVRWVGRPGGARFAIKRDQLGSDLGAMNKTEIVFVQVKGGKSSRSNLAAARAAFAQFTFPPGTKQWIVLWTPRARTPEILVVSEGPCGSLERTLALRPKRRRTLPLFGQVAGL